MPEVVLSAAPAGGRVAPEVLAAAALAGVDEVYRVGGAQAVAAIGYGTATVRAGGRHRRSRRAPTWRRPSSRWPASSGCRPPSPARRRWSSWPTPATGGVGRGST